MKISQILSQDGIKRTYQEYIARFNAKDFEGLKHYLSEDMYFFRGRIPPLIGRGAFFEFYTKAWQCFDEHITIRSLEVFRNNLTVDLTNNLHVFKDWLDCPYGPFHQGLEKELTGYVVYTFNNQGKIAVIVDMD